MLGAANLLHTRRCSACNYLDFLESRSSVISSVHMCSAVLLARQTSAKGVLCQTGQLHSCRSGSNAWGGSAAASCLLLVTTPAAVHQCVHMCANVGRVSCCVACCRAELDASWACLVKAATLPNASWELFEHLQCRAASGPGQAHAQCGVHSAD